MAAGLAVLLWATAAAAQEDPRLVVPEGAAPALDGRLGEEEWAGAATFDLGRGEDVHGRGFLRRAGRQLFLGFESRLSAYGTGVRFNFREPLSGTRVVVLVVPLNPPGAPLGAWIERPQHPAERLGTSRGDLRMTFPDLDSFVFEARLPLDFLEIGRDEKEYGLSAEMWDLIESSPAAAYPLAAQGPTVSRGEARLRAENGWGVGAPDEALPAQEALELLERIQREKPGDEPGVLANFLGFADGRRREAPLAALEERLAKLVEAYPDYVSLRFNLGMVISGRNDPARALGQFQRVREDFPMLRFSERQLLMEVQLLRDAGRYDDAIALLDEHAEALSEKPQAELERRVLASLRDSWKAELEIRAEEEAKDDLPRVRLDTTKGAIVLELLEDDAPNAVANFVSLVEKGFYDGTRFHWADSGGRVVGGDPNSRNDDPYDDGYGDPGYLIESDPGRRLLLPYMVSFADRRRERRAEGCVFILHIAPLPGFDGVNSTFARVVEGEDVVRRIEYYDTLEKATVLRKRDHPYVPVKR